MFQWLNKKRAQNTAEYAILIGVIVAAAIAMQVYVRRGMSARVKDAVDYSKDADSSLSNVFKTGQYEPYYSGSNLQTTSDSTSSENMQDGGGVTRDITNEYTSRTGTQTVGNYTQWNTTP